MERRVNKRIETYVSTMKNDICGKINEMSFDDTNKINEIVSFVFDYNRLTLDKQDFIKRKRLKNSIPITNRCTARKANNEQCTRRRKDSCEFCGTHSKGVPHGLIETRANEDTQNHKLEVFGSEIGGIIYYMDKYNNIYKMEDIMAEKINPEIIGTYKQTNGVYELEFTPMNSPSV